MQPNQPSPAPPPIDPKNMQQPDANPYDFIVNPQAAQPKKKLSLLPAGGSKAQRFLIIGVGVVVLILLFILGSTLLNSGDKAKKEQLTSVVAQQKELIRISEIGIKKSRGTDAKNLAVTTQITLTSEQPELLSAIKTLGMKSTATVSSSQRSKSNDTKLTAAEQANNFDEVFTEILQAQLLEYTKSVQTAYKSNSSTKTKAALESQFKNAATLAGFKEE